MARDPIFYVYIIAPRGFLNCEKEGNLKFDFCVPFILERILELDLALRTGDIPFDRKYYLLLVCAARGRLEFNFYATA